MFSSQEQVSSNINTDLIQQAYKTISGQSVMTARKDGIVGEPLQSYNNFQFGAKMQKTGFWLFLDVFNIILVELSLDGTKDDKNWLKTETNIIRTESRR